MRNQLLGIFLFAAGLMTVLQLHSQDVHFSQFYLSPLNLNPSQTGAFGGDWRVSANYRTQWRALDIPFTTFSLGYDRNFSNQGTTRFSGGLLVLHDQSGNAVISFNKAFFSGAFHISSNNSNFHIGAQAGVVMKSYNLNNLSFPDQYDVTVGNFNLGLPNNENALSDKKNYPDISAGISWDKKYEKTEPRIGFALYHLNRPNESFFGSKFKLPIRKVFHFSYAWQASQRISFVPKILYMEQVRASEITFGTNIGYHLNSNSLNALAVYAGAQARTGFNRNTDAWMILAAMSFERMDLGLSYDVNISSLKRATNKRGAIELALIFWSGSTELKPKTIPCDRY